MLKFKAVIATWAIIFFAFTYKEALAYDSMRLSDYISYVEHTDGGITTNYRDHNLAFWKRHNWLDDNASAYSPFLVRGATFSTGATIVVERTLLLGSGEAAEKWCKDKNMRLPTLDELEEMYEKRGLIGNLTDDGPEWGWPYWSQRVTNNSDGKNYGYLIYFGDTDQVNKWCEKPKSSIGISLLLSKGESVPVYPACNGEYIEQGDILYVPFGLRSGVIAAFQCVYDGKNVYASQNVNAEKYAPMKGFVRKERNHHRNNSRAEKYVPVKKCSSKGNICEKKKSYKSVKKSKGEGVCKRKSAPEKEKVHKKEKVQAKGAVAGTVKGKGTAGGAGTVQKKENVNKKENAYNKGKLHKRGSMYKIKRIHERENTRKKEDTDSKEILK
ncbi:MAG: hypothetical protein J6Y53_01810 [Alphaproteobacteria bacterium]|nr:hypothetical protein [Alphaproteobacteria bacterium]